MMKNLGKRVAVFLLCLIVVTIGIYSKPVLSSRNKPVRDIDYSINDLRVKPTSIPYHELNSTGLSRLIGMTEKEVLAKFPEAKKKWTSTLGVQWYVVGTDLKNAFEFGIKDHVVSDVFAIGTDVDTEPFKIGMTLADISEITTVFSNFTVEYGDQSYQLELTEEDMNYRPIVAFNNNSFANLHINQETGELIAVRYLDKRLLLEMFANQVMNSSLINDELELIGNWDLVDRDNLEHFKYLMRLLSQRDKHHSFYEVSAMSHQADASLDSFVTDPSKVLKGSRLEAWKNIEKQEDAIESFAFNADEIKKITELGNLDKKSSVYFYYPIFDVPSLIVSFYGNRFYHEQLVSEHSQKMGVSFNKTKLLVVLSPEEKNKATTESSEINE